MVYLEKPKLFIIFAYLKNIYNMQKLNSKRWPKKFGIYCIINLKNGKRYVGSAIKLNERLTRHHRELIAKQHFNEHLQRAWDKYGETNFKAFIIESFDKISYEELLKIEDNYIKDWNLLDPKYGYNKRTNDTFPILSKESIDKRKEKHDLLKKKIMAFYSDSGKFYKEWDSLTDAAADIHDQTTNISNACHSLCRSVKGFVFIYSKDFDPEKTYKKHKPNLQWTQSRREKQIKSFVQSIKIYTYDSHGNFLNEFISCTDATNYFNLKKDSLSHMLKKHNNIIKYNSILFLKEKVDIQMAKKLYKNAYEYLPGKVRNQFI